MKLPRLLVFASLAIATAAAAAAQDSIRVLAYSGQSVGAGGSLRGMHTPRINSFGLVAFLGTDQNGAPAPWITNGESLQSLAPTGARLEGAGEGVTIFSTGTEQSAWLGFSNRGLVATYVRLQGAGVTEANALGLLVATANGPRIIARSGDPLPGGAPGRFAAMSTLQPPYPVFNGRDEIVFAMPDSPPTHPYLRTVIGGTPQTLSVWRDGKASLVGLLDSGDVIGLAETNSGATVVFKGALVAPQAVLTSGDVAPGLAGEVVADITQLVAEPRGRIGIVGRARRTSDSVTRWALWEGFSDGLSVVLRELDVVDGLIVREIDSVRLNGRGTLAARVYLADSATSAERQTGIAVREKGVWRIAARAGQNAPGDGSGRFTNFDGPVLNALGQVAFLALVTGGTTQHGVWGGTATDIRALVRSRDPLTLPTGAKTISSVPGFGAGGSPMFGVAGGVTPLGDNGVLVQCVDCTDGTRALLAITLPAIRPSLGDDRLINISTRAQVAAGDNALVAGFVVSGDQPQRFLIRGLGPKLADFGVTGALPAPDLRLFRGAEEVAQNRGWSTSADRDAVVAASTAVGAFSLTAGAADSALVATLPPGAYTTQLRSATAATGVGLIEVYHVREARDTGRPVNLSSRAFVGRGAEVLIPGIVIAGNAPKTLLIRAVGPTLATNFGVEGALQDPQLAIFQGDVRVGGNEDWATGVGPAVVRTAGELVGAFPLRDGSRDAALCVTLAPGNYTVQVSGRGDTTGIALVEVYELGTP